MIDVITAFLIIIYSEKHKKAKAIQPGNREWFTIIECINVSGWCIPLFMIIKGTYYLANWNIESGFSDDWIIKSTDNGWINNETGLN